MHLSDTYGQKTSLTVEADRCVKCGLCLPVCPTYLLTRNESDSPRGRISLIEALASDQLHPGRRMAGHLHSCLLCRQCESACPSGVRFSSLMLKSRQFTRSFQPAWLGLTLALVTRPRRLRQAIALARMAKRFLRLPGHLGRLLDAIPRNPQQAIPAPNTVHYPDSSRGSVGLFLGCADQALNPGLSSAATQLLQAAGYRVVTPIRQGCCGALHATAGQASKAAELAETNRSAFDEQGLEAVITLATGCSNHLMEHAGLMTPVLDIGEFLARNNALEGLTFSPLKAVAAIHIPCSQNPVSAEASNKLLTLIPGLKTIVADGKGTCCGAAGSYFLTHPDQARQLRMLKTAILEPLAPDYLVTSNPGCGRFITEGMKQGSTVSVHPIELLFRQLATG